jgi:6,7-dimethyl-8-ribityllumazine synthase
VTRDIDESSENVLSEWSRRIVDDDERDAEAEQPPEPDRDSSLDASEQRPPEADEPPAETGAWGVVQPLEPPVEPEPELLNEAAEAAAAAAVAEPAAEEEPEPMVVAPMAEHAVGELRIPDGYAVLEGEATGGRRAVGVVVSRFNGEVTTRLLERALAELEEAGVAREAITVLVVPGAFELPLAATALAKTRRFACVVALGCVIRGETPHFEYVAGEAASGLQLAALETGVPVSFGVLTLETAEQADARIDKGAEAVRTALEMADVFAHLRAAASR